jgi:hypothetical protein
MAGKQKALARKSRGKQLHLEVARVRNMQGAFYGHSLHKEREFKISPQLQKV